MSSRWGNLAVLLVFRLTAPAGAFFFFTSPGMGYPRSTAGLIAGVLALAGLALLPVALGRNPPESAGVLCRRRRAGASCSGFCSSWRPLWRTSCCESRRPSSRADPG
jgi:hypothetical protein